MAIPKIAPYPMPDAADAPAARVSWALNPARAVLLIHDMQEYFLKPYDRSLSPLAPVLANTKKLRAACRNADVPVVFSAQPGEQDRGERGLLWDMWGPGIIHAPELSGIASELRSDADDVILHKRRYSAFFGTALERMLAASGRNQLWISGVYGHIGCLATALDGFMRGVRPFLIADAIADFSREDHLTTLRQVARTCGRLTTTDEVLHHVEPKRCDRLANNRAKNNHC